MSDLPIAATGQKTGYRVRLAVFEGPLDLLLQLIEREELDITRVSLARVTDQYLEYLAALEEMQVGDLTDFVVVAARLLLVKSQALLPRPPAPTYSEEEDAADALLRQLQIYKQFKQAAKNLEERQIHGQRSYVRLAAHPHLESGIEHLEPVSLEALLAAAVQVIQARATTSSAESAVTPFTLSIDDQINLIIDTLKWRAQVDFSDLLTEAYCRQEVAVTLLALLELIKQHRVQARQERMFGRIMVLPMT